MKKETKLMRIPQIEKFTDWSIELPHKNIILDSIMAYGCKKDKVRNSINIHVYLYPDNPPTIVLDDLIMGLYDSVLIKYYTVEEATKLTIEAEDYIDTMHDSKGNYTFCMEKDRGC